METVIAPPKVDVTFTIYCRKVKSSFLSLFKTINHSTVLPILEDVLVVRKSGMISFSTTDLETITTISYPDDGLDFSCVLPGMQLRYLINNSITGSLSVVFNEAREKIDISDGRFGVTLWAAKVSDYPRLIEIDDAVSATIDTKEILPYLEKTLLFVSDDDLRPAMTGVYFTDWKGFLHIVSTDAHRLYWHPVCKTPAAFKDVSFILSARSARILLLAFKSEKDIVICKDGNHVLFMNDGKEVISKPLDCRYPKFEDVIPEACALTIKINRAEFLSFLRMCSPFTNKSTRQITIEVYPDKLKMSGGDVDFGIVFSYDIPLSGTTLDTFNPFRLGMNAKFLIDGLLCSKDELVEINTSMNPLKAVIVDGKMLIMPLQLNS